MKKLLSKIKNLRKATKQDLLLEKIANLEAQMAVLEQANVIILTKLLQIGNTARPAANVSRREEKSEIIAATPQGLNAGKTPTVH